MITIILGLMESKIALVKKWHLKWLFTTKRNLSTDVVARLFGMYPWFHTETNTVRKSVLPTVCSSVLTASEPLSLICRCGINSLLPGFEWMLAPLGEHLWLWSLPSCSFTATVKERIPVLMDPQSRRVIIIYKGECNWGGSSHERVEVWSK